MTLHRRTEITVETDQVVVIRRRQSLRGWCSHCGCEVDMVGLAEAQALTGMAGQELQGYAEARGWHLSRGHDGSDVICLQSWLKGH